MARILIMDDEPSVRAISGGSPHMQLDVLAIARHFGARRTFRKPFDVARLLQAVDEVLADRRAA